MLDLFNKAKNSYLCNTSYPLDKSNFINYKTNQSLEFNEDKLCLYIHIPFCTKLCSFCEYVKFRKDNSELEKIYIDILEKDIDEFLNNHDFTLYGFDIGGGTPTSLSAKDLETVMKAVSESFDLSSLREYTVEAGRPDSITKEKLEVMKHHGCTRISINPQTMNLETLRTIGRAHTPADIKQAMNEARKVGFKNINMDIIAGLPNETLDDMAYTLDEIEKMKPESITVHSLAIKRAADLNQQYEYYKDKINQDMDAMISLATRRTKEMGMVPYYLYRQKNIAGNLENTGFAKEGLECIYNVLIMEERLDTFAAGAGAVTRLLNIEDGKVTRVDRVENVKNIDEYITRLDEMLTRKQSGVDSRIIIEN